MKINIQLDITPAEGRSFLGLPDVEPLQREVIEHMRGKVMASLDAFDPLNLNLKKMTDSYFSLYPQWLDAFGKKSDK
ncbi:MAG: hypothetical protein HQL63_01170 [Magnetococcales bacterium]|nr:hypothetical protein [Magnetococcales bacterium]MBF0322778.1 hypothetical protein [Magnetococcales bacterium]